ncbi:hypothetical protein BD626DRAFT_178644 [Schizophyllum amplum]|uniref:MYND-type domain-containing protein n=1 Tax=Schizophyllum amplum TaxID=97359 RepID=A0A550C1Q1_9AGAR|nr:hypothetical protein BD626DRAFT_178644 [Auriculariopsis ampla]
MNPTNSISYTAGSRDLCSYLGCNQPGQLRKCARCQLAWYCSRECQKAHWKDHKKTCQDHLGTNDKLDPLLKWIDKWRLALEVWSGFALNLHNRENHANWLAGHSFLIEIEKNPDPKASDTRRGYLLKRAGYFPDAELRQLLAVAEGPVEHINQLQSQFDGLKNNEAAKHFVMMMILFEDVNFMCRQVTFALGPDDMKPKMEALVAPGADRRFAAKLAEGYIGELRRCMQQGKVEGYKEYYALIRECVPPAPASPVPRILGAYTMPISAETAANFQRLAAAQMQNFNRR